MPDKELQADMKDTVEGTRSAYLDTANKAYVTGLIDAELYRDIKKAIGLGFPDPRHSR
jgi:hypothetical protein